MKIWRILCFRFLDSLEFTHFLNTKVHFTPINKG